MTATTVASDPILDTYWRPQLGVCAGAVTLACERATDWVGFQTPDVGLPLALLVEAAAEQHGQLCDACTGALADQLVILRRADRRVGGWFAPSPDGEPAPVAFWSKDERPGGVTVGVSCAGGPRFEQDWQQTGPGDPCRLSLLLLLAVYEHAAACDACDLGGVIAELQHIEHALVCAESSLSDAVSARN